MCVVCVWYIRVMYALCGMSVIHMYWLCVWYVFVQACIVYFVICVCVLCVCEHMCNVICMCMCAMYLCYVCNMLYVWYVFAVCCLCVWCICVMHICVLCVMCVVCVCDVHVCFVCVFDMCESMYMHMCVYCSGNHFCLKEGFIYLITSASPILKQLKCFLHLHYFSFLCSIAPFQ